jgi:LPPG:FO 2-phospho-L-lactate transferase
MADACLAAIDVAPTADAVAAHYGARRDGGLLDAWVVDEADADTLDRVRALGIEAAAVPAMMRDVPTATALAADVVRIADGLGG